MSASQKNINKKNSIIDEATRALPLLDINIPMPNIILPGNTQESSGNNTKSKGKPKNEEKPHGASKEV